MRAPLLMVTFFSFSLISLAFAQEGAPGGAGYGPENYTLGSPGDVDPQPHPGSYSLMSDSTSIPDSKTAKDLENKYVKLGREIKEVRNRMGVTTSGAEIDSLMLRKDNLEAEQNVISEKIKVLNPTWGISNLRAVEQFAQMAKIMDAMAPLIFDTASMYTGSIDNQRSQEGQTGNTAQQELKLAPTSGAAELPQRAPADQNQNGN
jgi:hypothetical protein